MLGTPIWPGMRLRGRRMKNPGTIPVCSFLWGNWEVFTGNLCTYWCSVSICYDIIGGYLSLCSSQLFGDVWILDTKQWIWQELEVENRQWEAPQLWCHPAVYVKDTVIVFSIPRHQAHVLSLEGQKGAGQRPGLDGLLPMQIFILDCSQIHSHFSCTWKPPPEARSFLPATSLHSAVVARGEILVFGRLFTRWTESTPDTSSNLVAISAY